jgi:hypothetical protein
LSKETVLGIKNSFGFLKKKTSFFVGSPQTHITPSNLPFFTLLRGGFTGNCLTYAAIVSAMSKFSKDEFYGSFVGKLLEGFNFMTFYETDFFKKNCLRVDKTERALLTNPFPSSYVLDIIKTFFLFLINSRVLLFLNFELYVRLTF